MKKVILVLVLAAIAIWYFMFYDTTFSLNTAADELIIWNSSSSDKIIITDPDEIATIITLVNDLDLETAKYLSLSTQDWIIGIDVTYNDKMNFLIFQSEAAHYKNSWYTGDTTAFVNYIFDTYLSHLDTK
ncbi:MAG: hypothetical protein ATN33_01445 [Epulopiscium sp. Nele67-Bin001]|nr:MAG: hypothetical protein BEN18_07765 [Epulopiscium sp. Nuni2H_MBin001]OON91330.1 MAG: hypothetical protein ATN33_01445 [Epulopiscium sp. Nele67-Bin001]